MSAAPTRLVGVDIGSTAVRVVELDGVDADSLALITKAAIVPLQPGAMGAGRIRDPRAVAQALSSALREAKVSPYGIIIGLSSPDVALARISIPGPLSPAEWGPALRVSGESISPKVPMDAAALSMYSLAQVTLPDGTVASRTLLAGAALTADVDALREVCRFAKATPRAVDLAGAATMRCLTRARPGNDEVATLVDIGDTKITVATRQGLHLRSLRTLEGGGDLITRAIAGASRGMTHEQAEAFKLSRRLSPLDAARADASAAEVANLYGSSEETKVNAEESADISLESMTTAAERIIDDIAAAIESDAAQNQAMPTAGILLCGGTSLLRGFKERLVERIGVPAVVGRPWARATGGRRTEHLVSDGVEDPIVLLSLATAIGLALWKEPS
jgi:type IV pilus assembly protein PilM